MFHSERVTILLDPSQFEALKHLITSRITPEDQKALDGVSVSIAKLKENILAIDVSIPKG